MKTQQLKELAQRATPWPWKWFTSNSHNRLSSVPSGKDGDVISAFKAVDGVSCVSVSRADMAFIEASHPGTVLELIDRIEAAERERDEYAEGERLTAIKNVELQDEIYGLKAELARRDAAAGEPVAWISERNLKDLGKAFSVRVKHEPVMVRPIALYTAAQPQPVVVSPADSVPEWVKCSEQMPPVKTAIIVGKWNGRIWATKWATYIPSHPEANSFGYLMPGGSWEPDFWMPLPAAPEPGGDDASAPTTTNV